MLLKDKRHFYFTQNSLNTFSMCGFKFKKKYIDNIKWQNDGNEEFSSNIEFGTDFHKIAERYFRGIEVYEESFKDNLELYNAYMNLKEYFPIKEEFKYYPEYTIRYAKDNIRLEANIDLIIEKDNEIEIWDWKTNVQGSGEKYIDSLQTKIYMSVLKSTCKELFNKDFSNIKMVYFSPERKEEISCITYSDEKYINDEKYVAKLIEKVYNSECNGFSKTKNSKLCKFCEFNVFCNNIKDEVNYEFSNFNWEDITEVY